MSSIHSLLLVVAFCLLAACGAGEPEAPVAPPESYDLRGEVIRLVPDNQVAVIKHEDIDGWMKAMTMEFPVKDAAEFEKLTPGSRIEAKVYVQDLDFWIGDIVVSESQ